MGDNEKKVPKRRFKEFENDEWWEERKLKQIANFAKGYGYSKNDLRDVGTPIILYGRLYTKYQSTISEVNTFTVPKSGSVYSTGEEVIVPASGETSEDIARASAVVKSGFLLGGDLNIIYPNKDINTVFLALSISNGKQQKELSKRAQGKSVVHLHNSDLEDLAISFPCRDEQQKIGGFFNTIDNIITLHQRKLDKMKALKKAYLTDMFPAEGERKPKLRFTGFTDDWEQCSLSDVAIFIDGNYGEKYPKDNEFIENGVPFFTSAVIGTSGVFDQKNVKYISEEKNSVLVKAQSLGGDIILTNRGASMGIVAQIPLEYGLVNIGPQLTRIRGTEKADNLFLLSMFKNPSYNQKLLSINSGSAMNFVGLEALGKFEFMCPKLDEQVQIGVFFKSIDNLITLHQRKLEKLQNIKKAYLNEMFI